MTRAIGGDHLPWTAKLEDVFAKINLHDIAVDDRPFEPIWSKFWHEHEMLFTTQIMEIVSTRDEKVGESMRKGLEVVQRAKYEGKGYVNNVRPVVAVGRKPIQQN